MRKDTLVVQANQSVIDISIQVYGSIEAAFDLMEDNPTVLANITDEIPAGTLLYIPRAPKDKDMVSYYKRNAYLPANAVTIENIDPIDPPTDGDYNNDFNNDFNS
jgi:hypothetical protein